jgi:hypothetical protein
MNNADTHSMMMMMMVAVMRNSVGVVWSVGMWAFSDTKCLYSCEQPFVHLNQIKLLQLAVG